MTGHLFRSHDDIRRRHRAGGSIRMSSAAVRCAVPAKCNVQPSTTRRHPGQKPPLGRDLRTGEWWLCGPGSSFTRAPAAGSISVSGFGRRPRFAAMTIAGFAVIGSGGWRSRCALDSAMIGAPLPTIPYGSACCFLDGRS